MSDECPRCRGTGNINHENKGALIFPEGPPKGPRAVTLEHRCCPECGGSGRLRGAPMPDEKECREDKIRLLGARLETEAVMIIAPPGTRSFYDALARVALEFCEERKKGKIKAWESGEPIGIACRDIKPSETVTLTSGPGGDIALLLGYMEAE